MSTKEPQTLNNVVSSEQQARIVQRIQEADISLDRGISLRRGTKEAQIKEWTTRDLPDITLLSHTHYGIRTGEGLVVFDIDEWDDLSSEQQAFLTESDTLRVKSPHASNNEGHYYFVIDSDTAIPSKKFKGGDLQGEKRDVVGPGSILTECKHGCCSKDSPKGYHIESDTSIAAISKADITDFIGKPLDKSSSSNRNPRPITWDDEAELSDQIDKDMVAMGEETLRELRDDRYPDAFHRLMDLLRGGRGGFGDNLSKDTGKIDRSKADFITCSYLIGVFRHFDEPWDRAKELTYHLLSHFRLETNNGYMKDGQPAKWVTRNNTYRNNTIHNAFDTFNRDMFTRFLHSSTARTTSEKQWNNDYSEIGKEIALFAVDYLIDYQNWSSEGLDILIESGWFYHFTITKAEFETIQQKWHYKYSPRATVNDTTPLNQTPSIESRGGEKCAYPEMKEVIEFCVLVDEVTNGKARDWTSFKTILQRIRRNDRWLKQATMKEGVSYVYYRIHDPDPPDAVEILGGVSEDTSNTDMTDNGDEEESNSWTAHVKRVEDEV